MKYKGAVIAVLIAAFCRLFLISVYKMPFESMAPSILAGDFILASQISYGFKFPVNQQTYFESAPVVGD